MNCYCGWLRSKKIPLELDFLQIQRFLIQYEQTQIKYTTMLTSLFLSYKRDCMYGLNEWSYHCFNKVHAYVFNHSNQRNLYLKTTQSVHNLFWISIFVDFLGRLYTKLKIQWSRISNTCIKKYWMEHWPWIYVLLKLWCSQNPQKLIPSNINDTTIF